MDTQVEQDLDSQQLLDRADVEIRKTRQAIDETNRLLVEVDQKTAEIEQENRQTQEKLDGQIASIEDDMDVEMIQLIKATEVEE